MPEIPGSAAGLAGVLTEGRIRFHCEAVWLILFCGLFGVLYFVSCLAYCIL